MKESSKLESIQEHKVRNFFAFYRQEGTTSLKAELSSTYKIYQSNYQGMQYARRITDWVKENRIPTPAGKEMLRELQIFSGRLQGKDVKALEAKLLKAVATSLSRPWQGLRRFEGDFELCSREG